MPIVGLAYAIDDRSKGGGRERLDLPQMHDRPVRRDEITFNRNEFAREIRWIIFKADADPWGVGAPRSSGVPAGTRHGAASDGALLRGTTDEDAV